MIRLILLTSDPTEVVFNIDNFFLNEV